MTIRNADQPQTSKAIERARLRATEFAKSVGRVDRNDFTWVEARPWGWVEWNIYQPKHPVAVSVGLRNPAHSDNPIRRAGAAIARPAGRISIDAPGLQTIAVGSILSGTAQVTGVAGATFTFAGIFLGLDSVGWAITITLLGLSALLAAPLIGVGTWTRLFTKADLTVPKVHALLDIFASLHDMSQVIDDPAIRHGVGELHRHLWEMAGIRGEDRADELAQAAADLYPVALELHGAAAKLHEAHRRIAAAVDSSPTGEPEPDTRLDVLREITRDLNVSVEARQAGAEAIEGSDRR